MPSWDLDCKKTADRNGDWAGHAALKPADEIHEMIKRGISQSFHKNSVKSLVEYIAVLPRSLQPPNDREQSRVTNYQAFTNQQHTFGLRLRVSYHHCAKKLASPEFRRDY
jgi:hypothetical protein